MRARFGKKDDDDDCDKKDEDGEKKTKHSIDGILGDKGQRPLNFSLCANRCEVRKSCVLKLELCFLRCGSVVLTDHDGLVL